MEGPISKSTFERLPACIKALDVLHQKVYIGMRLRKTESAIASQLKLSLTETKNSMEAVRHELAKAGQLYLIENPYFVSIHSDDPDVPDMPIVSHELDAEKKLIIKEFMTHLKDATNSLPTHQSQLLRLRYKHRMSAKEILGFCNRIGESIVPGKGIAELDEQDVFYALNSALKDVLKKMKTKYREAGTFGLENLKYIFEEAEL